MDTIRKLIKLDLGKLIIGLASAITLFLSVLGAGLADVSGIPRVVDGDTIVIGKDRIRLHGIDAPEQRQTCSHHDLEWACGEAATGALSEMVGDNSVTCRGNKRDRYDRLIAVCFVAGRNLNASMVRDGWAVAYRKYSTDYVVAERNAAAKLRGIWKGNFTRPWEWREKKRK